MGFFLRRKPKRALVLGCGPAGLFAAHALIQSGWKVNIWSKKRRSEMYGAQYLHAPIHELAKRETTVTYVLVGTEEQYRQKVYGERIVDFVSPQKLAGVHSAWDIRAAYYDAWDRYHNLVANCPAKLTFGDLHSWEREIRSKYQLVISSIPARSLCGSPSHFFGAQAAWAIGDAPERGIFAPFSVAANSVVCDGTRDRGWYRASNVFGYRTVEWPEGKRPPVEGATLIEKPISTNCDCLPWIERVGRYGTWSKGEFSHDAYYRSLRLAGGL